MEIKHSIDLLNLNTRAYRCLTKYKILTIEDLKTTSKDSLAAMANMGVSTLKHIEDALSKYEINNSKDIIEDNTPQKPIIPIHNVALLNYIDPNTKINSNYILRFKHNNEYHVNLNVNEIKWSSKINNCLHLLKITNLYDLVYTNYGKIYRLPSIGKPTIDTLIKQLADICQITFIDDTEPTETNEFIEKLCAYLYKDINNNNLDTTILPYNIIRTRLYILNSWFNLTKFDTNSNKDFYNADLLDIIYSNNLFTNTIYDYILYILKSSIFNISLDDIKYKLPKSFTNSTIYNDVITKYLLKLIDNNIISVTNNKYSYNHISIYDYINICSDRHKDIIISRLEGMTLENIGNKYKVTRERIRQIITNVIKDAPILYEDKYKYWYTNYNLTVDDFTTIFNVKPNIYYYLSMRYENGSKSLLDLIDDENISDSEYNNITTILKYNYINLYNQWINKYDTWDIVACILREKYLGNSTALNELYNEYKKVCIDNDLNCIEKISFKNGLGSDMRFNIVRSNQTSYRFYNSSLYNIPQLINHINFKTYMNSIISAKKIYEDYSILMNNADIRSEYELHNLFKKYSAHLPKYITLKKAPSIKIGENNILDQAIELIDKYNLKNKNQLADMYSKIYGMNKNTFIYNYLDQIDDNLFIN